MALGSLDRGHVARWLRHFRSWRGDADYHRCFSHSTRRGRSHWSKPGVWCCDWSRSWRADGGPSWPKEVDAGRHDDYCRRRLYQCGTASGFAAGVAKLGATIGVFLLPIVKQKLGVPSALGIILAVSLLGLVVTAILGREDTE